MGGHRGRKRQGATAAFLAPGTWMGMLADHPVERRGQIVESRRHDQSALHT